MKAFLFGFLALYFPCAVFALTCADVDGAYIVAKDGQNLGFFGSQYAADSVFNRNGTYGNPYSPLSIRNIHGLYGSPNGNYSGNSNYATEPPAIMKNGQVLGYVTTNRFKVGGVSLMLLDATSGQCISNTKQIPNPAVEGKN